MNSAEHLLRVAAALAILLLAVVQEHICPWLDEPLEPQPVAANADPVPDDAPEEPPPLQLLSVLPDALAPRATAGLHARLSGRGQVPGIAAQRDDHPRTPFNLDRSRAAVPFPRPAVERVAAVWRFRLIPAAALHTSITPTGPPAA